MIYDSFRNSSVKLIIYILVEIPRCATRKSHKCFETKLELHNYMAYLVIYDYCFIVHQRNVILLLCTMISNTTIHKNIKLKLCIIISKAPCEPLRFQKGKKRKNITYLCPMFTYSILIYVIFPLYFYFINPLISPKSKT